MPRHPQLPEFEQQDSSIQGQNMFLQTEVANLESDQEAFKHAISDMDSKLQKSKTEIADLLSEIKCEIKAKELIEGQLTMKNQDFNELHDETLKLKNEKRELDTMETETIALRKELEDNKNRLKEGLEKVELKIKSQRKSFEENLKELKDFKATKMREEKRQRKAEKKKFRKEKKRLLKAVSKNIHQLEASESVVDNLFESDTVDNSLEDDEQVDCTICAETIKDYVPKYCSGIVNTQTQPSAQFN